MAPGGRCTAPVTCRAHTDDPPDVVPPCDQQRSPLWPFTQLRPGHNDQRAPDKATRQHSPGTPQPPRGSMRSAGARHQSRMPPSAARCVTFRADDDNSTHGPGGRQRRQMSPAAEPQRQTKRPRTDRMQIPTILPPTEQARLAALNVHTGTAEATASSPPTAACHARTSDTTPGPQEPPAAPHTATAISAPAAHPSPNGYPTSAPQRRPECLHAPPHTSAYAEGGTQSCEAGATAVSVATAQPTMAAEVPPGKPDAAHAASPTRCPVQAQSAELKWRPHHDPGEATLTIGAPMTERTSGTTPSPAARPSLAPSRPGPSTGNMHTELDDDASGDTSPRGTLAAEEREVMRPQPPGLATLRGPPRPGGTTEGTRHLPQTALTQPGRRPASRLPGRPQRPSLRGGPPPTWGYRYRCAATPGAPHPGTTYPGRPHRRVDLVVSTTTNRTGGRYGSSIPPGHTCSSRRRTNPDLRRTPEARRKPRRN